MKIGKNEFAELWAFFSFKLSEKMGQQTPSDPKT